MLARQPARPITRRRLAFGGLKVRGQVYSHHPVTFGATPPGPPRCIASGVRRLELWPDSR